MSFSLFLQFPSSTAKFIGCWQAVTVHTWATQLCRKWKDFWSLVDHANHTVNCLISHVSQPLCGSLLGKQAAPTQSHPQFGRSSHMTPQGWPWYSLSVCLLTSHSSCQPVMKLKCQHRHTHPHTTTLLPLWHQECPLALFTNGLHIKAWAVGDSGPDCFVSAIPHTFTHTLAPQSPCLITLLQCVEVHGREGSIKIWVLETTGRGGMRKEEDWDKERREVSRGNIKSDKTERGLDQKGWGLVHGAGEVVTGMRTCENMESAARLSHIKHAK